MDDTATCPVLPNLDTLPFAYDRSAAWAALLGAGKVAVSDAGVYFLSGAAVVEQAARSPEIFSSRQAFEMIGSPFPMVPIAFDRPEHTRYRHVLDKFFSPRRMIQRAPELREQLGVLIESVRADGDSCEVISRLAIPFPSQVFLTLFGLPLADRDRLIAWKDATVQFAAGDSSSASQEQQARAVEMLEYLTDHLDRCRGRGGDDLRSQLLDGTDEQALTDQEIIGLCFLFVIAGLDTVTSATGFALYELARSLVLQRRLRQDETLIPAFIEELLRVSAPVPYVPRRTTQDVEVAGVMIPAGSTCWLGLGAANRDSARFDEPTVIQDYSRAHFAFGRGPHRCLGSHLARVELKLIVEEWNRRIPNYTLISEPAIRWPSVLLHFEELHLQIA